MHSKYAIHIVYIGAEGQIRGATSLEVSSKLDIQEIRAAYKVAMEDSNYRTEVTVIPLGAFRD